LAAPVEIRFEQKRALRVGGADLFKQLEDLCILQRGQLSSRKPALETPSLHAAAVVVKQHLKGVGTNAGFLPSRLSRISEESLYAQPRRHR
jgi:hypothetical protein